jgi:hypothetical protein
MAVYPHPAAQGGSDGRLVRKLGFCRAHRAVIFVRCILYCRRSDGGSVRLPPSVRRAIVEGHIAHGQKWASGDRPQRELEAVPCVVSR